MLGEIETEIIEEVIEKIGRYHKYVPQYGNRAWLIQGKELDVIYWDTGNGWCYIIDIIPKNKTKAKELLRKFFTRLRKAVNDFYSRGY